MEFCWALGLPYVCGLLEVEEVLEGEALGAWRHVLRVKVDEHSTSYDPEYAAEVDVEVLNGVCHLGRGLLASDGDWRPLDMFVMLRGGDPSLAPATARVQAPRLPTSVASLDPELVRQHLWLLDLARDAAGPSACSTEGGS